MEMDVPNLRNCKTLSSHLRLSQIANDAQILAAELIMFIVLSPESLYIRRLPDDEHHHTANNGTPRRGGFIGLFGRINPKKLTFRSFLEPLFMLGHVRILVATIAYAMVFNWVLVLLMVEVSPLYGIYFHLDAQQIGINYLSFLVGSVLRIFSPASQN
jgi:hypothetical protein